jgi:acyl carrier protein
MVELPTQADVEATLYAKLAESRGTTAESARADVGQDGRIDSIEGVELIAKVELHFGITFSDNELLEACHSIPRIREVVVSRLTENWKESE